MEKPQFTDSYSLDPERLPRRVELDLPAELLEEVLRMAAQSGRAPSEIILELLDRALTQEHPSSERD